MFLETFKLVYQQPSQYSTSSYDYKAVWLHYLRKIKAKTNKKNCKPLQNKTTIIIAVEI